jgi:hypothetical protein
MEMYLLSTERRRLQQELAYLDERRSRLQHRLVGIRDELARLQEAAQGEDADELSNGDRRKTTTKPVDLPSGEAQQQWKTVPLEY